MHSDGCENAEPASKEETLLSVQFHVNFTSPPDKSKHCFYHSWDGISLFVFSNLDFANCLTSILLHENDKSMKKIMDEKKWVWEREMAKREVEVEGLSAHPHILAFHQCSKRRRWWRVLVSIHLIPLTRSY